MGAAFLAGLTGIEHVTLRTNAAYLDSWISTLKGARLVIQAGAAAQKAVDHILNRKSQAENEVQ
jgi:antirestriction protein ArdC